MGARDEELVQEEGEGVELGMGETDRETDGGKGEHLRRTKAAEVRVVRNMACLRRGEVVWRARAVRVGGEEEGKEA